MRSFKVRRLVSMIIALVALVVSVLAVVINTRMVSVMERQVRVMEEEAELRLRPWVSVDQVNTRVTEDENEMEVELELVNFGVLPAVISHYSLRFSVDDTVLFSADEDVNIILSSNQMSRLKSQRIIKLAAVLKLGGLFYKVRIEYSDVRQLKQYFYEGTSEYDSRTNKWIPWEYKAS